MRARLTRGSVDGLEPAARVAADGLRASSAETTWRPCGNWPARSYTIDKLPFNFRYCGLIHKALPKASIVHLTRDPMDTCYAVFKTLFMNVYHFAYQLDELAEYYVAYRRMMDHWHAVMPGVILDVSYERARVGSRGSVPAPVRALWAAVAGRGARLPPLDQGIHDGEHGAGAPADLPVLRPEVAQLCQRAAARAAAGWRRQGSSTTDGNPLR